MERFCSFLAFFLILAASCNAEGVHSTGDVTWAMMSNERGDSHVAIISGMTPDPQADIILRDNVTFILYTLANNATDGVRIYNDDPESITQFNPSNPTKILIHGFWGDLTSSVIQANRIAYFEGGYDYNLIGVDWGVLCPSPWYNLAKDNALLVGAYVGQLINFLVSETGADIKDFHLIGHSLGGQVVGIAGFNVANEEKVARITGLDPALPLFDIETDDNRLDPTDADLVDVIHTDGGGLAWLTPVGHIDFYPNGGKAPQPGCGSDLSGQCSHTRGHVWFADSINNRDKYPARLCQSFDDSQTGDCDADFTGVMGDAAPLSPLGIYYLQVPAST